MDVNTLTSRALTVGYEIPSMSSTFLMIPRQRRNASTNSSCAVSSRARRPKRNSCGRWGKLSPPAAVLERWKFPSRVLAQCSQCSRVTVMLAPHTGQVPSTSYRSAMRDCSLLHSKCLFVQYIPWQIIKIKAKLPFINGYLNNINFGLGDGGH